MAVFSLSRKGDLGKGPILGGNCGNNNILMKSADALAKAVHYTLSNPKLYAEGNWWDSTPPRPSWFVGNVDYTPYYSGPATPDSCQEPTLGPGGGPGARVAAANVPLAFELEQNYPNPFNPTTTIRYALPEAAKVELKIYNILGQTVKTLVDEEQLPGFYRVTWDGKDEKGRNVASGTYLYQIRAGDFVKKMKMQLIK